MKRYEDATFDIRRHRAATNENNALAPAAPPASAASVRRGGAVIGGFLGVAAAALAFVIIVVGLIAGVPPLVEYGPYILAGLAMLAAAGAPVFWNLLRDRAPAEAPHEKKASSFNPKDLDRKARDRTEDQQRASGPVTTGPEQEEQILILLRERLRMRAAGEESSPQFEAIEDDLVRLGWK